jgi:DNA-binding transcriptional MocR family regulator
MVVLFSTLARPGDVILTEAQTDPGMKDLANLLQLRLQGIPMDDEGIRPEALEAACRSGDARILFLIPTLHNPTTNVMPPERRKAIARLVRAHDLFLVEDDVYGLLPEDRPEPISRALPDRGFYFTSLSKTIAPGLRLGYLAAPRAMGARLASGIRATLWMTAPLLAEIATLWINDGTADRILVQVRRETAARQEMAARILAPFAFRAHRCGYHLWLELPEPWRSEQFVAHARRRGVAVTSPEAFVAGRSPAPHAVRVCLGAAADRARLEQGLTLLKSLLESSPDPGLSVF